MYDIIIASTISGGGIIPQSFSAAWEMAISEALKKKIKNLIVAAASPPPSHFHTLCSSSHPSAAIF